MQWLKRLFEQVFPLTTLNRDLKILFVSNIVASFGDGLTVYLLPLFIRELHATEVEVGFLYSVLMLASAVTIIPGGFLADKYDLKKILVLGWAIWVPVPLFFVFAISWIQLIPAMFLYGVLISGPASSAYVVGRAQKSKMVSTFTILVSAWGIGYTFAPTVAGYIVGAVGMQWVFFLTTALYFVTLILTAKIGSQYPEKVNTLVSTGQAYAGIESFKRRRIFFLSVLFAGVMFFFALIFPLVPQFLKYEYGYDTFYVGVLGSFTYFGGSTLSLVMGKIGDKYGKTTSISVMLLFVAVALGILVFVNNFFMLILASFLRGASFPAWSFIGATVGSIAPPATRARWISVVQTATQVSSTLAPYVGGVLYANSPQTPFLITVTATLGLSLLAQMKPFRE